MYLYPDLQLYLYVNLYQRLCTYVYVNASPVSRYLEMRPDASQTSPDALSKAEQGHGAQDTPGTDCVQVRRSKLLP